MINNVPKRTLSASGGLELRPLLDLCTLKRNIVTDLDVIDNFYLFSSCLRIEMHPYE